MPSQQSYFPHIDGLRGWSVLLVVLFHAFPESVPGGFIGVDVFFVISGFIITRLLIGEMRADNFTMRGFLLRRVRRLWPPLFVVGVFCFALAWLALSPEAMADFAKALGWSLGFASNWYFFAQTDYFNDAMQENLWLHTWSLSIEEQFYLVFPLILLCVFKRYWLTIACMLLIGAVSLTLSVLSAVSGAHEGIFFATQVRIWQLIAGVVLALAVGQKMHVLQSMRLSGVWAGVGFILILVSAFTLEGSSAHYPGYQAIMPVMGAILCLSFGQKTQGFGRSINLVFNNRVCVGLGLISYGLYLWHWPILKALAIFSIDPSPSDIYILVAIGVSVLLSVAMYKWMERPIRQNKILSKAWQMLLVFALGTAMLACAVLACLQAKGFAHRMSPAALAALETGPDERSIAQICQPLSVLKRDYGHIFPSDMDVSQDIRVCLYGDTQRAQIDYLFWGDSHMGAIATSVANRVITEGQLGVTAQEGACPSLLGVAWGGLDTQSAMRCGNRNTAIVKLIQALQPRKTVMVSHWDVYAPQSMTKPGKLQIVSGANGAVETGGMLDAFATAFKETVREIAAATEVIVLLDVPTHDLHVPRATAHALRWPWLPEPGWIKRTEQEVRRSFYVPMMQEEDVAGHVSLVDPLALFCPEDVCLGAIEGDPLFFDYNHLSQTGADKLVWGIEGVFD